MNLRLVILCLLLLPVAARGDALIPDGRLATNHWMSYVGVRGGVPNSWVMTVWTNFSSGATLAQVNAAIGSCPSNQVIQFSTGTFTFAGSLLLNGNDGVVLRGDTNSFPSATVFNFTDNTTTCYISIRNPYHEGVGDFTTPNWTAGFTRGTTTVTVSSTTGLAVGDVAALDQANDDPNGETSYGGEGVCGTCDVELDGLHAKQQHVVITGISGNDVSFLPPLFGTNWNRGAAYSPRLLYTTDQSGGARCGIESLYITATNDPGAHPSRAINFRWVHDGWVKDVYLDTGTTASENHGVEFDNCVFMTVSGSWFHNIGRHGSKSYSVAAFGGCGYLVTDNLFFPFTSGIVTAGGVEGCVFAYNVFTNSLFEGVSATAIASTIGFHGGYANYILVEGNWGQHTDQDMIHGSSGYITYLRNYMSGWQTGMTEQTIPMEITGSNYFNNAVGNLEGYTGYHDVYEHDGTGDTGSKPVYALNFWDANTNGVNTNGVDHYDDYVKTTLIRVGNWNAFNAAIPSAESVGATNIPSSYYLDTKPALFGRLSWPPFDPLVPGTGTNIFSVTNIPAGYRWVYGTNPPAAGDPVAVNNTANVNNLRVGP